MQASSRQLSRIGAMRRAAGSRGQRGQGMTEYIIIVALVAVAAIGVYNSFGQTIRAQTAGLTLEMAGREADGALKQAKTSSDTARSQAESKKGLDSYGAGNH